MKQKHYLLLSILSILWLAACQSTPAAEPPVLPTLDLNPVVVTPTVTKTEPTETPVTETAVPATATTAPVQATAVPIVIPVSQPNFGNLTLLPNRASLQQGWPQPYTPITTNELYAVWNYSGMSAANEVERLWYYNGTLWLNRREMWDMAKYGANGRVTDIFVYDYEPHLAPGHYRVVLKVDGVEMASADHTIAANTISPIVEPSTGFTAAIQDNNTLVLRRVDGTTASWVSSGKIVQLVWIPGGRGVVYTEEVVINPDLPGTLGLRHNLWLQNVISGEKWLLGNAEEDMHTPVVSPDGRHIAVLSGTLYGDACGLDADLHILELTNDLYRSNLISLEDFADLPVFEFSYPQPGLWNGEGDFAPTPGHWVDNNTLEAGITWICEDTDAHGFYELDVNGLTAVKVADFP